MGDKKVVFNMPSAAMVFLFLLLFILSATAVFYAYKTNNKIDKLDEQVLSLRNENNNLRSEINNQKELSDEMIQSVVQFYDEYQQVGGQTLEGLVLTAEKVEKNSDELVTINEGMSLTMEQVNSNTSDIDELNKKLNIIINSINN